MTSFIGLLTLNDVSPSLENSSAAVTRLTRFPAPRQDTNIYTGDLPVPHGRISTLTSEHTSEHIHNPTTNPIVAPAGQALIPPMEGGIGARTFRSHVGLPIIALSQENLSKSTFIAQPQSITPIVENLGLRFNVMRDTIDGQNSGTAGPSLASISRSQPTPEWSTSYPDEESEPEVEDPEHVEARLFSELALDRQVESNTFSFVVHGFASWMTRFNFEPARIFPIAANHIRRGHMFGQETHQNMLLVAGVGLGISQSMDYDPTDFNTLQKKLVDRVMEIRARSDAELTRELALATLEHCHEFISTLFKVGSLASILNVMDLYAPIFRRACPESSEKLVNLPQRLTTINPHLQYYPTLDVLQSIITHRPMFFRYDLRFLSSQDRELLQSDDGPGLRWLYGVPDRLMIVLARMNTLFEDFANRVGLETVLELEKDIAACSPVMLADLGTDPILSVGRMIVQESWKLAAQVYLYMGLCGRDSLNARVVQIQREFMKLLGAIRPRRNPDSFLVLPIAILGVATTSPEDRSVLLKRLWGVSECKKPDTLGNDIVRMLNDIWARTAERPAVWADLRTACLRVTGM
ncbi:hypothetical protein B0J17DRAFT_42332 [Rhizoctonia solani]|nr:hypothetical protein B0J17DRAFT_42332 [Rhizoctonia solani]